MTLFIFTMVSSSGRSVVMSTPASFSNRSGLQPPADKNRR